MSNPFVVDRPFLLDVCAGFASALIRECQGIGRADLAAEVSRVVLPLQIFAGSPEAYRFLAYAVPGLTYEERQRTEVRDFEMVRVPMRGGEVGLELDAFGRIAWFYVSGLPEHFEQLQAGARQHAL
jgi:hypothetical protein